VRICVLVFDFPLWSETFIVDHIDALLRAGHSVSLVPMLGKGVAQADLPDATVRVARNSGPLRAIPASRLRRGLIRAATRLRSSRPGRFARDELVRIPDNFDRRLRVASRVLREGPFDVVHAQFGSTAAAAVALRRHGLTDAPIVCSIHGTDANVHGRRDPALFARTMRDVTLVTVGTGFMGELVHELGVDAAKIRRWPQGVDVDRPPVVPTASSAFRVLSASRLVPFKGVDDSLRVIAAARSRIPTLRYSVFGDGPMRAELELLARELGVDDITTFAGPRTHDEVLRAHGDTDVFLQMGVLAADGSTEGQGVAPAEASISGLPCVVTSTGGLPEVVIADETGIVVAEHDIAAGADALVRLAGDAELCARLGAAGRAFVTANFSMQATTQRIVAIYEEAIALSR
jgi:colanic acid/amylovoran biosynthesis glycosyltransferase